MLTFTIISIIVGAICFLSALFVKKNSLKVILGFIGITLLLYGGFSYGAIAPMPKIETYETGNSVEINYPVEKVQITSPVDGDVLSCRVLTMGVYPEPLDNDIWVLIKPSDDKFYPQSDYTNASYKEKGKWQVVTRFGGDKDESYELLVYETDPLASQFFNETIQEWKTNNDYQGIEKEDLPEGIRLVDQITVKTEFDCRGIF
jgi:hypothetical protein